MVQWRKDILGNGLRVITAAMPHLHSAELAIYLKVGGRDDPPGKEGLSHLLEHMLFRGCRDYPTCLALENAFEAIGGAVNAATDAETTCFYSRIHPGQTTEGLRILAAMLLDPLLADLETEKRIVTEEALDDLNEKGTEVNVDSVAARLIWPDHPLGKPTVGTLESIASFSEEDLREHLGHYYRPGNAVLVAAGKVDHAEVLRAAEANFGRWEAGQRPPTVPFTAGQVAPRWQFVADEDSQVHLQMAFRGISLRDPRLMTLRLLRRLLSGGGSSRLHLKLREEMGVVYSVDAAISAYADTGSFSLDFSTAPENLETAVAATFEELRRIVTEPVDEGELERVRRSCLYELEYGADSCYDMQIRYGWGEIVGLVCHPEEERREMLAIDVVAIGALARELFGPDHLNLVAVGPVTTELRGKLEGRLGEYERWFREEIPPAKST